MDISFIKVLLIKKNLFEIFVFILYIIISFPKKDEKCCIIILTFLRIRENIKYEEHKNSTLFFSLYGIKKKNPNIYSVLKMKISDINFVSTKY